MQPMSPMSPMSQDHSQAQNSSAQPPSQTTQSQPHHPNQMNDMRNNMVVDPMDVPMMQQQQPQNLMSSLTQYNSDENKMYRNNVPPVNNNYSMQTGSTQEQVCVSGPVNGHDVQMTDYNNGLMRKIKTNDETVLHQTQAQTVQSMQHSQQYLLSAGPSDRNNYGMSLKQEPEMNF